ncbi:9605_t:CDS:2, partial [Dentiscutata heterogama]
DASGIIRSRSLDSSLKIFLKGFYPQNTSQELGLPPFEKEDVLLVTGKFRTIEHIDENGNKAPALKIILNDLVPIKLDPNNVPSFPILINMTAVVDDPPVISDDKDVTMSVIMHDHVDQEPIKIQIECYYSALAPHLMRITEIIKKNSVLYINGELILYDDTIYVHVKSLSFPEGQKKDSKISAKPPWESESSTESNKPSVAKTIAARVKNSIRRNKEPISSTTNPYPQANNRRKITDLAKEALANSNKSSASTSAPANKSSASTSAPANT